MTRHRMGRGVVAGLCVCLTASVGFASIVERFNGVAPIPSVSALGTLNNVQTGSGLLKVTVNTRTGNSTITGRGFVPNLSGKRQVFRNLDVVTILNVARGVPGVAAFLATINTTNIDLRRGTYTVEKSGSAHLTGNARIRSI